METLKKLVLIDGHAMLYRAWFAFPPTLTQKDGTLVNAVYGFTRILLTVIAEMKPEYLCVSFDVGKTFRHEQYPAYKAHREKMPEELKAQEPLVDKVLGALNVPIIAKEGFEADDVIGTLAWQASDPTSLKLRGASKLETVIVTGDKDAFQLVRDPSASSGQVRVYMPAKASKVATLYDETGVFEEMGIRPDQIPDFKGLAGDHSDNIPGVRGIGPKTAVALLKEFERVEGVYDYLETRNQTPETKLTSGTVKKLMEGRESALESKRLATIVRDVDIKLDLPACVVNGYDKQGAMALFEEMGFKSLIAKLPKDEFEESIQEALF
jgi:DNA polymerase I